MAQDRGQLTKLRPSRARVEPFLPLCDSFGASGKSLPHSGLCGFLCKMTRPDWSTDMTDSLSQQEAEFRLMDAWWGGQSQIRTLPAGWGVEHGPTKGTVLSGHSQRRLASQEVKRLGEVR